MKNKLKHLIIASLISLIFAFSPVSRIFLNDNYGVAFGAARPNTFHSWCGWYNACSPPVPPVLTDYYVDDDNISGPWNGTKANPYNNIEDAISAASTNNTIYVAGGIYQENLIISKKVTLEGGWDYAFSQRDISVNVTTIDGSGNFKTVIKVF